jgi:IS30 family transposase
MTAHLTMEQRQLARRLDAKGLSLREIARQVGCSHEVVRTVRRRESRRPVRLRPVAARARSADPGRSGGDQSRAA